MNFIYHIGKYAGLIRRVFSKPEKWSVYRENLIREIVQLGIGSLPLILIISVFMGGVICIQTAYGLTSPLVPLYAVGFATRDSIVLEFSPTIVSLILAGRVGSSIASEIGSMRINEQIDALEIMGINSAAFLIMPKVVGAMLINPFLIIISMFVGVWGGYFMGVGAGAVTPYEYIFGIQYDFVPFKIGYSLLKVVVFAFIITTISAYHGYYTKGGALEVGKSGTKAEVYSCVLILFFDLVITQMLLA